MSVAEELERHASLLHDGGSGARLQGVRFSNTSANGLNTSNASSRFSMEFSRVSVNNIVELVHMHTGYLITYSILTGTRDYNNAVKFKDFFY